MQFIEGDFVNPADDIDYVPVETELTDGVWTDYFVFDASELEFTRSQSANLIFEYTKEDGTIGTLKTKVFTMYLGSYAALAHYETGYTDGVLSLTIDIDGVDSSKVRPTTSTLTCEPSSAAGDPITAEFQNFEPGADNSIVLKYNINLVPGTTYKYQLIGNFTYTDSTGSVWDDLVMDGGLVYG